MGRGWDAMASRRRQRQSITAATATAAAEKRVGIVHMYSIFHSIFRPGHKLGFLCLCLCLYNPTRLGLSAGLIAHDNLNLNE